MNDNIDPAIVEKAAKAMADDWNPERDPILTAMFRDYAQTALEAVADDLRAEGAERVLEHAAQETIELVRGTAEQALREAAEVIPSVYLRGSTPAHWLLARADALEAATPLIAAKALEDARKALRSLADEWEQRAETLCPDHRPVQHRDAKEPWCKLCGLNASGEAPRGGVRANWGEVQP